MGIGAQGFATPSSRSEFDAIILEMSCWNCWSFQWLKAYIYDDCGSGAIFSHDCVSVEMREIEESLEPDLIGKIRVIFGRPTETNVTVRTSFTL